MKLYYYLLFTFLTSFIVSAQKTTISGRVMDESKKAVEDATVFLSHKKDSTLITYTLSDKTGNFKLDTRQISEPSFLTIDYAGYDIIIFEYEKIEEPISLGNLSLKPSEGLLDEIVVQARRAPIIIRNDTLEFNADSFKVRPDANVKELLKALPGVEVSESGEITVNGKRVKNLLVNNRPFFDEDGSMILQNLPAEVIDKVQVTTHKTKEQQFTGEKPTTEEQTINLTIKEEKNRGIFGKATAGYGTNDRYESSLLLNMYKGNSRISILASSNNVNSSGFSMDEIFDNMKGGRNQYNSYTTSSGGFSSVNGLDFGSDSGIFTTHLGGINYTDIYGKNDIHGVYLFTNTIAEDIQKTRYESFYPGNEYFRDGTSNIHSDRKAHSLNFSFETDRNKSYQITIDPKFKHVSNDRTNSSSSQTTDLDGRTRNISNTFSTNEGRENEGSILLRAMKKFDDNNFITFSTNAIINQKKNESRLSSRTEFFDTNTIDDRNQRESINDDRSSIVSNLVYRNIINKRNEFSMSLGYTYNVEKTRQNVRDVLNENNLIDNDLLSFENNFKTHNYRFNTSYQFQGRNSSNFVISPGSTISNYIFTGAYMGQSYQFDKVQVLPDINMYYFNFGQKKSFYTFYNYNGRLPSMYQLIPYANLSNPMSTVVGNPNLDHQLQQTLNMQYEFRSPDYKSRLSIGGYGRYGHRDIISSVYYDDAFKSYVTYENVNDIYNVNISVRGRKSFGWKEDFYNLVPSLEISAGKSKNKSIIDNVLYNATGNNISANTGLSFSAKNIFTADTKYKYDFNTSDIDVVSGNAINTFSHRAEFNITAYWPKKVVFGSDMSYVYNSNTAPGISKDYMLWNLSIGYEFFNDQFLAKIKMYDVLNQNNSVTRYINNFSITESETMVLRQYVMFSLTYKIKKFKGKQEDEDPSQSVIIMES